MYLVESPEDVLKLEVKNDARLSFMTQTTLSVDDTSDVIDALRARSENRRPAQRRHLLCHH